MALNTTNLDAAIAALVAEANRTQGTEESAGLVINRLGTATAEAVTVAVTAALADKDVTDQAIIDAAVGAVSATTQQFAAADDKLGAAIANNPGNPPAA